MQQGLRHHAAGGVFLGASIAAWGLLAWMALDMGHPLVSLTMPGDAHWTASNVGALLAMWAVMMAAMMLPSALPVVLAFVRLNLQQGETGRAGTFVTGYLVVWSSFSALATGLQWMLQWLDWVNPMMVSTSALLTGTLLLIAGAYQFSPLKRLCLAGCRTPMGFLMAEWRPRWRGAFAMGVRHGVLCTGCCWALMLLLFVGGVMNIGWVAALSLAVAIEKLAPHGELAGHALGLGLVAGGVLKLALVLAGA